MKIYPQKTEIYYSKFKSYLELIFSISIICFGIYLITTELYNELFLNVCLILGGLFMTVKSFKLISNKTPQMTIDSNGIMTEKNGFKSWSIISNERIIAENLRHISITYLVYDYEINKSEKIRIGKLNVSPNELKNIMKTYRTRYNKNYN